MKDKKSVEKKDTKTTKPSQSKKNYVEKKDRKSEKKKIWKETSFYFILIISIVMLGLIIQMFMTPILPMKYIMIIVVIFILLWLAMVFLQYNKNISQLNKKLGRLIVVVLSLLLAFGNYYYYTGAKTLNNISGADIQTDAISVVVLKDDSAEKIDDLKEYKFGILDVMDRENTNTTITEINNELGKEIGTEASNDINTLVQQLYDKKVNAIIMNEAYRGLLDDKFPEFDNETKVIYQHKIEKEIDDISKNVDVTTTPFNVFISGIDTYGSVNTRSRSDVNMLATVNPNTHQIVLTSIPRDYYVNQSCQGGQKDKLTHAGIFGVDCSVSSIETLFGVEINYYARVNFTSLINIVDSLGGITVENPNNFSGNQGTYFQAGSIEINGSQALEFSRERYSFSGGDRERGKNQMRVLTGIINKAISPSIITNYTSVMNAISGSFETNMSSGEITKFIQKQLDTMSGWDIIQSSVDGSGGTDWTPANGFNAYVMYPDESTVAAAKQRIDEVLSGKEIQY